MLRVDFDGRDVNVWILCSDPDGRVAAEGADFESVRDLADRAGECDEFAEGGIVGDAGEVLVSGVFERVDEGLGVCAGRGGEVGDGVGVDGGPAGVLFEFRGRENV